MADFKGCSKIDRGLMLTPMKVTLLVFNVEDNY
jgi:hypothetical protein